MVLKDLIAALEANQNPVASEIESARRSGAASRLDLLWERLGSANRTFLLYCADELGTREFTIEDMADAAGESEATVRARLRNIGRSLKSLGPNAPTLWETDWDGERQNYTFHVETRDALLAKVRRK